MNKYPYHYEAIKTYEDAVNILRQFRCARFFPDIRKMREANATRASVALTKLEIIARALNNGWKPNIISGDLGYRPQFYLYEHLASINLQKIERQMKYDDRKYIAMTSVTRSIPESGKAYYPLSLAVKSPEIAKHFGIQFLSIFAEYYYAAKENT